MPGFLKGGGLGRGKGGATGGGQGHGSTPGGGAGLPVVGGSGVTTQAIMGSLRGYPGLSGWGMDATGGRGKSIYTVSSLANDGVGSFRSCVADAIADGGGNIIFTVGGVIPLESGINCLHTTPTDDGTLATNVTVWGETAPSPGITFLSSDHSTNPSTNNLGAALILGSNFILRHVRVRGQQVGIRDCIRFRSHASNVVLGQVTVSWADDEGISTEGLASGVSTWDDDHDPPTSKRSISMHYVNMHHDCTRTCLINRVSNAVSLHRCSFWAIQDRGPQIDEGVVDVMNCFMGYSSVNGMPMSESFSSEPMYLWVEGCSTSTTSSLPGNQRVAWSEAVDNDRGAAWPDGQSMIYYNDLTGFAATDGPSGVTVASSASFPSAISWPHVSLISADDVKPMILTNCGARPTDRDSIDSDLLGPNGDIDSDSTALLGNELSPDGTRAPDYALESTTTDTFAAPSNYSAQDPNEVNGWTLLERYIWLSWTSRVQSHDTVVVGYGADS